MATEFSFSSLFLKRNQKDSNAFSMSGIGSQIRVERMKQEMDNYLIYSWWNLGSCSGHFNFFYDSMSLLPPNLKHLTSFLRLKSCIMSSFSILSSALNSSFLYSPPQY